MKTKSKNSFVDDVITLSFVPILTQFIGLFLLPIITRLYDPYEFGLFNTFSSITAFLGVFSTLAYHSSILLPKNKKDAIYLLYQRGKSMQEAVPVGQGRMIAVLGSKIKDLSDLIKDAKNATQLETSSPVPKSPEGILLISIFLNSSLILSVISVFIKPGETQLILIFFLAYSIAKLFENATIPAFDAE